MTGYEPKSKQRVLYKIIYYDMITNLIDNYVNYKKAEINRVLGGTLLPMGLHYFSLLALIQESVSSSSSLLEFIAGLPLHWQWQIQHHVVIGPLNDLVSCLIAGTIATFSGASLKEGCGTAAIIVSSELTSSYFIGVNCTTGHPNFFMSQRLELSGIDDIVSMIDALCKYFHLPYGMYTVTAGCDNMLALCVLT